MPASAHGTNAASAEMAGLETVQLKTNHFGGIDMDDFKTKVLQFCISKLMSTWTGVFI